MEALLMREPAHNVFHLSALLEQERTEREGQAGAEDAGPWAVGAFKEGELLGAVTAVSGTGGIYHTPGDRETLQALAAVVVEKGKQGVLSLLSGHARQVGAILPLIDKAGVGPADRCYFRTAHPGDLSMPALPPAASGFTAPRLGAPDDIEKLIDFYDLGFYSLAKLPTRAAWRNRLTEQLAYRTLYFVEDREGSVVSAALSSAEGGGAAMLGGVATRAEYRGMGLSALCVGALCNRLFGRGIRTVALFYLLDNAAAGRVYAKLGFQNAGEWILASLGLGVPFAPLFALRNR